MGSRHHLFQLEYHKDIAYIYQQMCYSSSHHRIRYRLWQFSSRNRANRKQGRLRRYRKEEKEDRHIFLAWNHSFHQLST